MLSHYLDMALLPDPEFEPGPLLDALFMKVHRRLVALQANDVAVMFPGYQGQGRALHLGRTLRLLGSAAALQSWQDLAWLQGMRSHVQVGAVQAVPLAATPCRLTRVQAKSGVERLRRRAMRRHGLSADEAAQKLPDGIGERLNLPCLHLRSGSTGQSYSLFLRLEAAAAPLSGSFNSYGLSATATVPVF